MYRRGFYEKITSTSNMLAVLATLVLSLSQVSISHKTPNCYCVDTPFQVVTCRHFNQTNQPLPLPECVNKANPIDLHVNESYLPNIGDDFFQNYRKVNVTYIRLVNNSIVNITKNVFNEMLSLTGFDLSWNIIDVKQLQEAFSGVVNGRNFRKLNCSQMGISQLPDNFFEPFKSSQILNISLQYNDLTSINYEALRNITGLQQLKLGHNKLSNITFPEDFVCYATLLEIDNNEINEFPNFCSNISHFPRLTQLNIQWNFMRHINPKSFSCLSELRKFQLNGNLIHTLGANFFAGLPSLEIITFSENFALQKVYKSAFNNSNLERVFFRKNSLYTQNPRRKLNFFEGCTSMKLLNMADNIMDKTPDTEFDNLFRPLGSLRILIMGGCRLYRIPPAITKYLRNLEELVLYNNRIATWPDGTLENLPYLKTIYMRQNEITTLSESSFRRGFRSYAKTIDFSDNPFHCSCDLRWFVEWMEKYPKTFHFDEKISSYHCLSPSRYKGTELKAVPLSDSICLLDFNSKIITLTGSTLLILFMLVGSVMYRYRWHIRYCVYMMRYKHRLVADSSVYRYDAFVAYSTEDRPWVIKTMMPVLEDAAKLKLCIHDRDFEVGKLIVDNIVDCVENSRNLIIVLSNTFAKSAWCQFELALIQRHVLEHDQRLLVVVLLEEIDTRFVTKAMRVMLQTTTYLMWGDEDYARKAFFNRLRLLLGKPNEQRRRLSL